MAYGVLYEFRRTSSNGADMLITISQKDYTGAVKKRALGRAPVIKRENNDHIYGTSCELYAECLVDGEFSHLYTSDAYEFKVEVYKNNILLWAGFVSPELYSEPDIAPPYDVQIIATDGLGELKNYNFKKRGVASILDHLDTLMASTGLGMDFYVVSGLRYINADGTASGDTDILSVKLDLDHEEGNSYYDVLQGLLSSLNANITQHNGRYLIFRETDFISKASATGVEAFSENGSKINLPIAGFGSMKSNQWWPVGQLSTVIEPAKNHLTLKSPNHYKENVLSFDNWFFSGLASYSEADNAYVLPGADSAITQTVDFGDHEVGYRLGLRVRARNVGTPGDEEQNIGIKVEVNGRSYSVGKTFWLVKSANTSGRPINDYLFRSTEGYIEEDLPTPTEGATSSDAQDIDIVVPLHASGSRSYVYAKNVKLTIFNPTGLYDIHVYDVSLVKYEQIKGYEANVIIENMARESESDIDLTITAGDLAPAAGDVFMTGLPMRSSDSEVITKWQIGLDQAQDYLAAMAFDYSRAISLPRMKYSGILNVPGSATILPTLFLRDGTYYFPKTYSYDLYADEITIDLISISAADVSLSSVQISQTSEAAGTMGTTTGGPAGGGSPSAKSLAQLDDVRISNPAVGDIFAFGGKEWENMSFQKVVNEYLPLLKTLGDWFYKTDDGLSIGTKFNLFSEQEMSANGLSVGPGGSGSGLISQVYGTTAFGTIASESNSATFNAYAIDSLYKRIVSLEGKATAVSFVPSLTSGKQLGTISIDGVSTVLYGVDAYSKTDADGRYLKLTGGTISGSGFAPLSVNRTSSSGLGILLKSADANKASLSWDSSLGTYIYNYESAKTMGIKENGTPYYDSYTLLHSGNIGSYKAGDSDKLGGYSSSHYPVFVDNGTYIGFDLSATYASAGRGDGYIEFYDGGWYNSKWGKVTAVNGFIGNLTGTASSATKLATARTIWGQSFDGSGNVYGTISNTYGILPDSDSAHDIGSATNQYRYVYASWFGSKTGAALSFGANNAVHMFVNTSGNVTIGASDLAGTNAKLYVDGSVYVGNKKVLERVSNNLHIGEGIRGSFDTSVFGTNILFNTTSGNNAMMIAIGGNVGIGTTAPAYKLDVSGTGRFTGAVTMSSTLSVSGNVGIGTSSPAYKLDVNGAVHATSFRQKTETSNRTLATFSGESLIFGDVADKTFLRGSEIVFQLVVGQRVATITSTGLGIGTNAPEYKLHVNGNAAATATDGTPRSFQAVNSNGTISLLTSTSRGVYDSTNSRWLIGTNGTNSFLLCGNVGIGTDAPVYKLDVNGSMNVVASGATARHIHVTNSVGKMSLHVAASGRRGLYDSTIDNWMIYTDSTSVYFPSKPLSITHAVTMSSTLHVVGVSTFGSYLNIQAGIRPNADNTRYVGTSSYRFNEGYINNMYTNAVYVGKGTTYGFVSDGSITATTIYAKSGVKISSGQALTFLDASGVEHKLTYDSTAGAFKFDGNILVTGDGQFNAIN